MKNIESQAIPVLRVEHNFKSIERLYIVLMVLALVVFALCASDVLLTMINSQPHASSHTITTTLEAMRAV